MWFANSTTAKNNEHASYTTINKIQTSLQTYAKKTPKVANCDSVLLVNCLSRQHDASNNYFKLHPRFTTHAWTNKLAQYSLCGGGGGVCVVGGGGGHTILLLSYFPPCSTGTSFAIGQVPNATQRWRSSCRRGGSSFGNDTSRQTKEGIVLTEIWQSTEIHKSDVKGVSM